MTDRFAIGLYREIHGIRLPGARWLSVGIVGGALILAASRITATT